MASTNGSESGAGKLAREWQVARKCRRSFRKTLFAVEIGVISRLSAGLHSGGEAVGQSQHFLDYQAAASIKTLRGKPLFKCDNYRCC